jgi:hypothetical protein
MNAIGCPSCICATPILDPDVSVSTIKCLLRLGRERTGGYVITFFKPLKALIVYSFQENASFFSS